MTKDMVDKENIFNSVRKLNVGFLAIVKEVGALQDKRGFVNTVLKIDDQRLKQIMSLDYIELEKLADVAVPMFSLKLPDLMIATQLIKKGNTDKAASLMRAGLIARCGTEEEK